MSNLRNPWHLLSGPALVVVFIFRIYIGRRETDFPEECVGHESCKARAASSDTSITLQNDALIFLSINHLKVICNRYPLILNRVVCGLVQFARIWQAGYGGS